MMENHGYSQIVNNPNLPYIDDLANLANTATNYFAVAHPSLTNYLEVVGGSNFGVLSDNNPDWHDFSCTTNLASGTAATDNPPTPNICPISGTGRMPRRLRLTQPIRPAVLPASTTLPEFNPSRPPRTHLARQSPISSRKTDALGKAIGKACRPEAPTP
jgi:hypothetical protein